MDSARLWHQLVGSLGHSPGSLGGCPGVAINLAVIVIVGKLAASFIQHFTSIIVDHATWTYAISLASLVLVVLLTDAARAQSSFPTSTWSGSLALGAMGILAVSSGNPFTLLITWSAIDILEVAILLISPAGQRTSRQVVAAFSARVFGTMALVGAMMLTPEIAGSFSLLNLPVTVNVLLLLACGLRLGVFPPNLPLMREPRLQRGLGSLLRLIPASTSLILLVRLPEGIQAGSWQPVFVAVLTMTALISSLVWSLSKDEVAGRAYWVAGWASLAIMCVVQGVPFCQPGLWGSHAFTGGVIVPVFCANQALFILAGVGDMGIEWAAVFSHCIWVARIAGHGFLGLDCGLYHGIRLLDPWLYPPCFPF